MHYKNGRAPQAGDRVVNLVTGQSGFLHSLQSGSTICNLSDCVHVDDVAAARCRAANAIAIDVLARLTLPAR